MKILDNIQSPEDIKALDYTELDKLSAEIRDFLVESVSKTGGHLSSNLGVVELTLAIHKVFDTSKDRLVFDVGHQSYVHKIITGRRDKFDTLRQLGGIAGFPKPSESVHDAFIAGHASNSISVALGMARARTISGDDYNVIALIGDGALTGGLSYEALSDAGESGERLIVILNDNGMSITENVGGIARHLAKQRIKPAYYRFKKYYRRFMAFIPGGKYIYKLLHGMKNGIKDALLHCSMFEDMGFTYLGPVDGHNTEQLVETLSWAKRLEGPVIVHAATTKGKGYPYAEENPDKFHGVGRFNPVTGEILGGGRNFSAVFGEKLCEMAKADAKICAITAAMEAGTGLKGFAARYPDRFFDVGIAEEHAVAMAAGMAKQGLTPVFAVYSTFLQRSYDMLLHDTALDKLHVVFAVDRAGLVGEDGETHHGVFDVGYLSSVPGMTVMCPASYAELRDMLEFAVHRANGPVAVRYPRGGEGEYMAGGVSGSKVLNIGSDFTLVTYGTAVNTAAQAVVTLAMLGVSVELIKLDFINPIDFRTIIKSVAKTGRLLVLEECAQPGCVGGRIAAELCEKKIAAKCMILKNLGSDFVTHGSVEALRRLCGIDEDSVVKAVMEEMKNE